MPTPQEQETPGTALGSPRPEPRYEPLRGSPAIGQAASAVRRISSLFTVAPLVDGAGGYLLALILGRDFPNSKRGTDFRTSVSAKGTCAWEAVLSETGSLQADETGYLLNRC